MTTVTTSWDDGDVLDLKVAELLDKYGIKGTFYITKNYRKERLSEEDIKKLSTRHEIGAHTLTHPDLPKVSYETKLAEMGGSKQWLESVLGKEVPMFCYPFGRYNDESMRAAKASGFIGARTTVLGSIKTPSNPFDMSTTVHVYPLPFRKKDAHTFYWRYLLQPWWQRGGELHKLGVPLYAMRSFETAACAAFDIAKAKGGVYHLWGHSWEIERYDLWEEFERVLKYIGNRQDCDYVTNGEVVTSTS